MDSEQTRIEKLLREGKISTKDAQKLLDVLREMPGKEKKAGPTKKKILFIISIIIGAVVLAVLLYLLLFNKGGSKDVNLLMNPGFETGVDSKVTFWAASDDASTFLRGSEENKAEFIWDSEIKRQGGASVSIRNKAPENKKILSWRQRLKTFPKKKLKLIGYMRTMDVADSGSASLALRGLKGLKEQTIFATTAVSYDLTGTKEWTRVQLYVVVSADTEEIQVLCQIEGSGEIWCDDLELRVVE